MLFIPFIPILSVIISLLYESWYAGDIQEGIEGESFTFELLMSMFLLPHSTIACLCCPTLSVSVFVHLLQQSETDYRPNHVFGEAATALFFCVYMKICRGSSNKLLAVAAARQITPSDSL